MIRVVLDTNIVVSALLRSGGLPHAVFNLAVDRIVQLCISEPILAEYEEVARSPTPQDRHQQGKDGAGANPGGWIARLSEDPGNRRQRPG